MPAQQRNEYRELAVNPDDLVVLLTGLLRYGIYTGFAAKYDGSVSVFAKADKKTATWNYLPMEEPIDVQMGIMELLGVKPEDYLT